MTRRLKWHQEVNKRVYAYNSKEEELGWLECERVGAHMHWCWYQYQDIRMSPGCLQEVRDKQKMLLKANHQNNKEVQK